MTPYRFKRPCLDCGVLSDQDRCPEHKKKIEAIRHRTKQKNPERYARKRALYDNPAYRRQAKWVRNTAIICHLCGEGVRPDDPWEADHIIPGDPTSPLASAHRSCNQRRGNKPIPQPPPPRTGQ